MDFEKEELHTEETAKNAAASSEIYGILRDFAVILAVVALVFVFAVRLVGVSGSSMYPTLVNKDYMLLLSNFISRDYDQGDIIVTTVPTYGNEPLVKRVIATEGQTVDIDFMTGQVFVDGKLLEEDYIFEPTWLNYADGMNYPVTVPEGCVFVMGDNRNNSSDSRYAPIGMVDTRRITGKVIALLIPGRQTDEKGNIIGKRDLSRIGGLD